MKNFNVRSRVLGNRVDFDSFNAARAVSFSERDIDLLWVGAIEPKKGTLEAIDIAGMNSCHCRDLML